MSVLAQNDLQIALTAAENFLSPVLRRSITAPPSKARSLLDALETPFNSEEITLSERRSRVLENAGQTLAAVQAAGLADETGLSACLQDSRYRRLIDGLFEIIVLEGIYPFVEPNVGIPLTKRFLSLQSVQTRFSVEEGKEPDQSMSTGLAKAINIMLSICQSCRGLFTTLTSKCLSDLVSCLLQLLHDNATEAANAQKQWRYRLDSLIKVIPSSDLFVQLTPLLHQSSPGWLRQLLTPILSNVPLRPDGVRALITFLATSEADVVPSSGSRSKPETSFNLSLDVLKRFSMALTTTPKGVRAESWYLALQPQLQALLASPDPDLRRAASYVIAIGILGRRETGSPDSVGWRLFVMPLLNRIMPPYDPDDAQIKDGVLSTNLQLARAIRDISTLCLTHPVPALLRRVVGRILFGLCMIVASRTTTTGTSRDLCDNCSTLLERYVEMSDGSQGARNILQVLLSEEYDYLRYSSTPDGITCRIRPEFKRQSVSSFAVKQKAIQTAIDLFEKGLTKPEKSSLCVSVLRDWISSSKEGLHLSTTRQSPTESLSSSLLPMTVITLLQRFQTDLAEDLDSLADLALELDAVTGNDASQETVALIGQLLPFIVALLLHKFTTMKSDSDNLSSTAIEKLNRVAFKSTRVVEVVDEVAITALQTQIRKFSSNCASADISQATVTNSEVTNVQVKLGEAMNDLTSPLAPIRAEGIAKYKNLLDSPASEINIPTTLTLFGSLLGDDDEYVYLAAVNVFEVLARVKPVQTLEFLCLEFVDQAQLSSLDKRLRISEALQAAIGSLPNAQESIRSAMSTCLAACIHLASRRVTRSKELLEREADQKERERQQRKLVQELGDEGAQHVLTELESDVTHEDELAASVLDRWQGKGHVEDVRLRSSALSCLEVILRKAADYVRSDQLSAIVELAFGVLLHERDEAEAILRRAAIVLLDAAFAVMTDTNRSSVFKIDVVHEYMRELDDLTTHEMDETVKGHLEVVRQNNKDRLEALLQVKVMDEQPRFSIGDTLRGLSVSDPSPSDSRRRPAIEELT